MMVVAQRSAAVVTGMGGGGGGDRDRQIETFTQIRPKSNRCSRDVHFVHAPPPSSLSPENSDLHLQVLLC